jgi:hypothetical protein
VDTSKKLEKKDLEGGKKSGICKIMGKKKKFFLINLMIKLLSDSWVGPYKISCMYSALSLLLNFGLKNGD